jgi:hypothetical protein
VRRTAQRAGFQSMVERRLPMLDATTNSKPVIGLAAIAMAALGLVVGLIGPAPHELSGAGADRIILPLAIGASLAVPALAVLRPWWGLLGWTMLMPLFNLARLRLDTAPVEITMTSVMVIALAIGAYLSRLGVRRSADETRLALVGSVVCLLALAAVAASPDPMTGLPIAVHGVIEPAVLAMIVVVLRPDAGRLVRLSAVIASSVAIAGLLSAYRMGRIATSLAEAQALRTQFGSAFYYNVNIFGEIIVVALPLALAFLVLRRDLRYGRWALLGLSAMVVVLLIALYFTFSKGAWLGGLAGVGLLFAWRAHSRARRTAVVAATIALSMLIVPIPTYVMSAVATAMSAGNATMPGDDIANPGHDGNQGTPAGGILGAYNQLLTVIQGSDRLSSWDPSSAAGEVSVKERLLAWRAAVRMTLDRPLLGVGPGRYGPEASGTYHEAGATRELSSAHSFFLNLGAEFGLAFAILIGAAIALSVRAGRRLVRSEVDSLRLVGLGVSCALVGFVVVASTTGIDTYQPYRIMDSDMILIGTLVGMVAAGIQVMRPAVRANEVPA